MPKNRLISSSQTRVLPHLIIIGPPKTGTTSIFNWISMHPDVCASNKKETYHFFVKDEEEKGIQQFSETHFDDYKKYFKECKANHKVIVEATPDYLYSESAIKAFSQFEVTPKFLFIYRDPVERMYSDYLFHRYKTKRRTVDFDEYIGFKPESSFSGKKVKQGYYEKYLRKWIEAFGQDNIITMHFENLKKNPNEFMQNLCKRIEIDPSFYQKLTLDPKNKTVKIKNRYLHLILLKVIKFIPKSIIQRVRPIYYKLNSSPVPKKNEKDSLLLNHLRNHYAEVNKNLFDNLS